MVILGLEELRFFGLGLGGFVQVLVLRALRGELGSWGSSSVTRCTEGHAASTYLGIDGKHGDRLLYCFSVSLYPNRRTNKYEPS